MDDGVAGAHIPGTTLSLSDPVPKDLPATTSAARTTTLFQGGTVQIADGHFNVVGGDSHLHTHIHCYGSRSKLAVLLDAITNFRKIQQDTITKATPGTVIWFLECDEFRLFIDVDGSLKILWGSGMPGAGKTILASLVIARLEALANASNGHICVGYVYIRYSDEDQVTIRGILEVLMKQAVERNPNCMPLCEQAYNRHLKEGTEPTEEELVSLLLLFNRRFKATFYVLDALDEAPVRIQLKIIQRLSSLGARLFITSRPLPALEIRFPTAHTFSIHAKDQDLDLHIAEKISDSVDLQDLIDRGDPAFKERLVAIVKERCGGMFLHATLQLDALQDCFTVHDAIRTLETFPRRIEDIYQQTWRRIVHSDSPNHASLAMSTFIWVLNAKTSMTITLLRHALATCPETYHFEPTRLMPEATILTACRGLITVDRESRLTRLVHYTAKELLKRVLSNTFPYPHSLLSAVCITRLADCGFQNTTITSWKELRDILSADPLLDYAYEHWASHAQNSIHFDPSANLLSTFVARCSKFPAMLHIPYRQLDLLTSLHVVAFYHLPVALIFPNPIHNPHVTTASHRLTVLHLACMKGHQAMVQSLLQLPGVLVHAWDIYGRTPLILACQEGHKGVVALLLPRPDLKINVTNGDGWTALMFASRYGHPNVVKLLLTHPDIDVNLACPWHDSTALLLASIQGHTKVAELLLAVPGINVNAVDKDGDTAIKVAAERGHEAIVRLLLDTPGIDISIAGTTWRGCHTAMSAAVKKGFHGIVRLLQDFEATRRADS